MTAVDKSMSVEYVPVNDYGTAPRVPASTILRGLGVSDENIGKEILKDREPGAKPPVWEGWVPDSNRNGETAKEDPELGKLKVGALDLLDNVQDESISAHSLDPRDNDNAPDEWKESVPTPKQTAAAKNVTPANEVPEKKGANTVK